MSSAYAGRGSFGVAGFTSPTGEAAAGGEGVGVVWAEDPLADWQELLKGGGGSFGVAGFTSPTGEAAAGSDGTGVFGAEDLLAEGEELGAGGGGPAGVADPDTAGGLWVRWLFTPLRQDVHGRVGCVRIGSWEAAELFARGHLVSSGFPDARLTGPGSDGGIDVVSRGAVAQVKFEAMPVGRAALQRLYGARGDDRSRQMVFYSLSGYTGPAIEYADTVSMALFRYGYDEDVSPLNRTARVLVAAANDASSTQSELAANAVLADSVERRPSRFWPAMCAFAAWGMVVGLARQPDLMGGSGWLVALVLWVILVTLALLAAAATVYLVLVIQVRAEQARASTDDPT